ncbi:hypothetical protein GCM10010421_34990 [Streptomyces glaucus]|uniref:Uncharacterized protein n=1 Tax=Streptomyces glaucus TaxID=284029 RepID=A0ABN3JV63_9ACTN
MSHLDDLFAGVAVALTDDILDRLPRPVRPSDGRHVDCAAGDARRATSPKGAARRCRPRGAARPCPCGPWSVDALSRRSPRRADRARGRRPPRPAGGVAEKGRPFRPPSATPHQPKRRQKAQMQLYF